MVMLLLRLPRCQKKINAVQVSIQIFVHIHHSVRDYVICSQILIEYTTLPYFFQVLSDSGSFQSAIKKTAERFRLPDPGHKSLCPVSI